MTLTQCDICRQRVSWTKYELRRNNVDSDYAFDYESFDVCGDECLAVAAVGEGIRKGAEAEHRAVRRKVDNAPKRIRKWWDR